MAESLSASSANIAITKLRESAGHVLAQRRPWSEIVDRSAYSKPASVAEASSRVRKNVSYFKVNYVLFMVGVLVLCLVTNPFSMFMLGTLAVAWLYLFTIRTEPLVINGRTLSEREKLWGMSALSFVLVFFLSSAGNVIFMGVCLGIAGVVIHGSFRVPDDLFLDDNEGSGGFFSFLKPPTQGGI